MAGDRSQADLVTGAEAFVSARDRNQRRLWVDMRDVETPGEQLDERVLGLRRDRLGPVGAKYGDANRTRVETLRVSADDVSGDASCSALEHLPVLIDEEVVADVVPAVGLHVIDLDPPHDCG